MEIAAFIISCLSLALSAISIFFSLKSQRLQDKVNRIELQIKNLELEDKKSQRIKKPCIEARACHFAGNRYKIKIWNSGTAVAKNILVAWEKNKGIIVFGSDKLPYEFLDPQKSFELDASTYDNASGKLCVTTSWEDENGEKHSKEQWCDF